MLKKTKTTTKAVALQWLIEHFKQDVLSQFIKLSDKSAAIERELSRLLLKSQSAKKLESSLLPDLIITLPDLPDTCISILCDLPAVTESKKRQQQLMKLSLGEANHLIMVVEIGAHNKWKVCCFYRGKTCFELEKAQARLPSLYTLIGILQGESYVNDLVYQHIKQVAIKLNNALHDYSMPEAERCLWISAALLALQDPKFNEAYYRKAEDKGLVQTPERLVSALLAAVKRLLKAKRVDEQSANVLLSEYQALKSKRLAYEKLVKSKMSDRYEQNFVICKLITTLKTHVQPLLCLDRHDDMMGYFYNEFIRYSRTDQKTGVVLTPVHISEFLCEALKITTNDVVFDSCCGTGRFLTAAMRVMLSQVKNDDRKRRSIVASQLIGIEKRTDLFTFAFSNFLINAGQKPAIYCGDSFSKTLVKRVKKKKPTVSLLNPPYDVGQEGQIKFIENALYCLQSGGRCAAIVQMSCVTSSKPNMIAARLRLLKNHTLEAVFSLPNEVFHPVGVITCVMVFKANVPHPKEYKSYFGYYKEDGFVKRKIQGRIDLGDWESIKQKWLTCFHARKSIANFSTISRITAEDEWCAESQLKTDYSQLKKEDFTNVLRNYVVFEFLNKDSPQ